MNPMEYLNSETEEMSLAEKLNFELEVRKACMDFRTSVRRNSVQKENKNFLIEKYSNFLKLVSSLPIGDRTYLKKSLGVDYGFEKMYHLLPALDKFGILDKDEEKLYALVARIYCFIGCPKSSIPFEKAISNMSDSDSFRMKFEDMLSISTDRFEYFSQYLIRFVRQAGSKKIEFDCVKLLDDLLNWDNKNKYVQHKWARSFYKFSFVDNNTEDEVIKK